jgi:hypothetical protein
MRRFVKASDYGCNGLYLLAGAGSGARWGLQDITWIIWTPRGVSCTGSSKWSYIGGHRQERAGSMLTKIGR